MGRCSERTGRASDGSRGRPGRRRAPRPLPRGPPRLSEADAHLGGARAQPRHSANPGRAGPPVPGAHPLARLCVSPPSRSLMVSHGTSGETEAGRGEVSEEALPSPGPGPRRPSPAGRHSLAPAAIATPSSFLFSAERACRLLCRKPLGTLRVKEIRALPWLARAGVRGRLVNSGSFTQVRLADRSRLLKASTRSI